MPIQVTLVGKRHRHLNANILSTEFVDYVLKTRGTNEAVIQVKHSAASLMSTH